MSGELQVSKISVAQGRAWWKWLGEARVQDWIYKAPSGTDNITLSYLHVCCQSQGNSSFILCFSFFLNEIFLKAFSKGITWSITQLGQPGDKEQSCLQQGERAGCRQVCPGRGAHLSGAQHPAKHLNSVSVLWERALSPCSRAGAREGQQSKLLLLSSAT